MLGNSAATQCQACFIAYSAYLDITFGLAKILNRKKHFNIFIAYKNTLGHLISGLIKLSFFRFSNRKNYLKYKFRVSGLINSYIGKKSWKRPIVN